MHHQRPNLALLFLLVLNVVACGSTAPAGSGEPSSSASPAASASPMDPVRLLAAGDIAACDSEGDEATAAILDGLDGTILVAGEPSARS